MLGEHHGTKFEHIRQAIHQDAFSTLIVSTCTPTFLQVRRNTTMHNILQKSYLVVFRIDLLYITWYVFKTTANSIRTHVLGGWESIVGVQTHCGRSRFWTPVEYREFPHLSRPALRPSQSPVQWVLGLFPSGKVAGARGWLITPSSAKVQETVQPLLYSPLCALRACSRENVPSFFIHAISSYSYFIWLVSATLFNYTVIQAP